MILTFVGVSLSSSNTKPRNLDYDNNNNIIISSAVLENNNKDDKDDGI
jgi:hypothetical protein